MKNKDQILLENLYSKSILKENDYYVNLNGDVVKKRPVHKMTLGGEVNLKGDVVRDKYNKSKIKLIAMDGRLHTPFDVASDELKNYWGDDDIAREGLILAAMDDTEDRITARWPNYNPKNLAITLYDARETGQIPSDTKSVLLPDGTEFEIDAHGV
jgi:hypothetical protein